MTDTQSTEQAATESKVGLAQEMLNMVNEANNKTEEVTDGLQEEQKENTDEKPSEEAQEVEAKEETSEEVQEDDTPKEEAKEPGDEFPLIPKEFSEEERAAFQELIDSDDEEKQLAASVLLERYDSIKKRFFEKSQDMAKERRAHKAITDVFEPLQNVLKQNNMDNATFTRALVNEYIQLNQNPADKIKTWVKQYNLKPSQLGFEDYDDYDYNEVDNTEVKEVKKEYPQMTEEQIRNEIKISQFAEATDAEGKLMHPHFDEVRSTMGMLIGKNPNLSLKEAYTKAILIEGKEAVDEPKEVEFKTDFNAIRERAKKAKKASKSIKTNSSKPDFANMSIAEELKARAGQ